MATVYFVRHGEYENPKGVQPFRVVGYPLSEKGKKQSEQIAKFLAGKNVEAVFSSPILRCHQTAEIIAKQLSKVSIAVDERLIEVGSPFTEMKDEEFNPKANDQSLYQIARQLEEGESAEAIVARMRSFLDEILEKYADKVVVAVSHGDPIMLLWCSLLGRNIYSLRGNWPEYILQAGIYELSFERGELVSNKLLDFSN